MVNPMVLWLWEVQAFKSTLKIEIQGEIISITLKKVFVILSENVYLFFILIYNLLHHGRVNIGSDFNNNIILKVYHPAVSVVKWFSI